MKIARFVALALFVVLMVFVGRRIDDALGVATGYSAKQMCSGVFVAGLPESFVLHQDIHQALGVLGPLLPRLHVDVDAPLQAVTATLFSNRSRAVFHRGHGCVLNPDYDPDTLTGAGSSAEPVDLPARIDPGLDPVLDQAFAEPAEGRRGTLAVVVLRNGELVAERYTEPATADMPLQGWSMNKSLTASWIGVQVERGVLPLDLPVRPAIDAVDPLLAEGVDPALNLSHLLHMESGFDFLETYEPGDDATRMLYLSRAAWRAAPGVDRAVEPGQRFSYSSGDTNLAAWIWQSSLGDIDYAGWLQQNFFEPIGVTSAVVERDASGVQVGSSYAYMTARDWARVGQFWLDAWHGRSELLSSDWLRASTLPRPSASQGEYGRGFWLNAQGLAFPRLPRDLFYASGHNGQSVVVFPEEEIVVVRLGLSSSERVVGLNDLLEGVFTVLQGADPG